MKRRTAWWAGVLGGILAAFAARLYSRRSRERIPSQEGLDDPAVARAYNFIAALPHMALMRWLVVRRAVAMQAQGRAVDLGCGPGYLVLELARQAPALHVTGMDLSEEMLAKAETTARRAGLEGRVSFAKGDVQRIPFADGSVDLVVSTLSLHHWSDPVAALDEVARVLRPGGSFLIADLRRDLAPPFYLLIWFVTRVIVPRALKRVNEPLGSRDSSYTPEEAAVLAERSRLAGWHVTRGPLWVMIEGRKP